MNDLTVIQNFENRIQNMQQNILATAQLQQATWQALRDQSDLLLHFQTLQLQAAHLNPLNRYGNKCFSQTDEDGITLEIVRRLGITDGVYAEFGVEKGLENNTLILAALGWRGFWVGGDDLAFDYSKATRFAYIKDWITLDNLLTLANTGLQKLNTRQVDVLSLDLDGNDIYFVEKLLSTGLTPKLAIVEYNGKFIPPTRFQIAYDSAHRWKGDDYFGAALMNFVDMFQKYGYRLICCNSHNGANAFFIHNDFAHLFSDVPENINDIYVSPRYHLYNKHGHPQSVKVVEILINK